MSRLNNIKTGFALLSFRLMNTRAWEVVEGFPSYAINRNKTEALVKDVAVALAAAFWAGVIFGLPVGAMAIGVLWVIVAWQ